MSVLRVGFETWQVRIPLAMVDMTTLYNVLVHVMFDIYIHITVIERLLAHIPITLVHGLKERRFRLNF